MEIVKRNDHDIEKLLEKIRLEKENLLKLKEMKLLEKERLAKEKLITVDNWVMEAKCHSNSEQYCGSTFNIHATDLLVDYQKASYHDNCDETISYYFICPICGNTTFLDEKNIPKIIRDKIYADYEEAGYTYYNKLRGTEAIREKRRKEIAIKIKTLYPTYKNNQ